MAKPNKDDLWKEALILRGLVDDLVSRGMGLEKVGIENRKKLIEVLRALSDDYELGIPDDFEGKA